MTRVTELENRSFTGVYKSFVKQDRELPDGAIMIEEFDSNCELHQVAKLLPFDKEEVFNDYTLEPDKTGIHVRRHPRTLLLPAAWVLGEIFVNVINLKH